VNHLRALARSFIRREVPDPAALAGALALTLARCAGAIDFARLDPLCYDCPRANAVRAGTLGWLPSRRSPFLPNTRQHQTGDGAMSAIVATSAPDFTVPTDGQRIDNPLSATAREAGGAVVLSEGRYLGFCTAQAAAFRDIPGLRQGTGDGDRCVARSVASHGQVQEEIEFHSPGFRRDREVTRITAALCGSKRAVVAPAGRAVRYLTYTLDWAATTTGSRAVVG